MVEHGEHCSCRAEERRERPALHPLATEAQSGGRTMIGVTPEEIRRLRGADRSCHARAMGAELLSVSLPPDNGTLLASRCDPERPRCRADRRDA